jgi:SAM-dependent methyltransferase
MAPSQTAPAPAPPPDPEVDLELLGHDAESWREGMRNGYLRAFTVHAIVETGVAAELRCRGLAGATAEELAAATAVDAELLDPVLTYLSLADRVLRKEGDRYWLTERGGWLFTPEVRAGLLASIDAYGCVLTELVPALRGEKRYGRDFRRRGDAVAAASLLTTRPNYPFIIESLRRYGIRSVADLGCGAAGLLVEFCRLAPELAGVGIDIDPGSLSEARRALDEARLSDRIALLQGDIGQPGSFAAGAELVKVEAFNCCGVLHEFFRDGDEAVIEILRSYKRSFPGRYFFLGEFRARTDEQYAQVPVVKRVRNLWYQHLMHPLSHQGLPRTRAQWMAIFVRADVELLDVRDYFLDQYVLHL